METIGIPIPGGTLTAFAAGPASGELVVLLHGFPQSRHAFKRQLPALASAGFRAVAVDQRGYSPGLRPDPADIMNYTVDKMVADVFAVADAVSPGRRFHLVGIDWGGAIAWHAASLHPSRLASLTVLSRPHPLSFRAAFQADAEGQRTRSGHHAAFLKPEAGPELVKDGCARIRELLGPKWASKSKGVPAETIDEYLSVVGNEAAMEAALGWYRAAGAALKGTEVGIIEVPTLYLWGEEDGTVGKTAAHGTGAHVAAAYRFVPLAGVGHFVTDEAPEVVNKELVEHVRRNPAGDEGRL
ncbi:putative hydrolase [Hyaloraphidium curvatum]|nr:putative hydrolase [Hyaloraphidium curvatum]